MRKLFKPINAGTASALISLTSLLSYAIGLLRDRIIAVNFGTTSSTDAYNASFLIPDILFNLFIAGALSAAFLPVFSAYLGKDKKEAFKVANTMLTSATLVITILASVAYIFMPQIVPTIFPESSPEMQKEIVNLTRILLPSAILFAISNTIGNILMSYKHFVAYAISPILYNLGIILGVTFLNEPLGIKSAGIGVLIGAGLHAIIRIIDLSITEYKYKPQLKVKHPGFKKILKLMLPKSLSLIAWQVNLYIFALIGIRLIEGGFAAFNYARNIQSFAVSLFGIAFATAIFPFLTTSASNGDKEKFTHYIQKTMQRILFFTVPAMVGLMLLSSEVISIILSGGVFDENSIKLTAPILLFFAISIPFESLVHILARGFYAYQNTVIPMSINLIAMTTIGLITYFVAPIYGIKWFSIGFSIGLILQVILLLFALRRKLENFNYKEFTSSTGKIFISSIIMAALVIISKPISNFINPKVATVIIISIGGGVYFLSAYLLKSPELSSVNYIIARILKKKTNEKTLQ